ncbi:MAG TPA: Fic family protein [Verrucomicrobiota bacterium]|nr:Fic family protein [Verrucomicrobiota bacterium]HPO43196.1 Fic family protein [Verrucomicrobiota bacterium]
MMTLRQFAAEPATLPMRATWYLTDLAEAKGRHELYTRQSPQKLKVLREHALIESAVSSNRIEGVEVDASRVATLMFGKPALRDRDEEEVRGYRDALRLIHESSARLAISEETIKRLHHLCRGQIWDAGAYKEKDVDIIQTYAEGRSRVRFKTVPASQTPAAMAELVELWQRGMAETWAPPIVLAAALNLDFLCVHPFRDGNGRVSHLLLLLATYHCGIEIGRYISLERLIEENKERYYEVLEQSSQRWHEGKHDPWPAMNFFLFILAQAAREFEQRLGQIKTPKGAKTALIEHAIDALGEFGIADLERRCPAVSRDMIRHLLRTLKAAGRVECLGRGPGAKWRNKGNTPKGGKNKGNNQGN